MKAAPEKAATLEKKPVDLASLGKTPVSRESPAGGDVQGDPEFEELQAEAQKALSVVSGGSADWEKIVRLAANILALKSKNIMAAGYLALGLTHTRKMEGFILGFGVYLDVIETYWKDFFPAKAKPKARSRAISWWIERTTTALKSMEHLPIPPGQAETLLRRCETAGGFLTANLEECPSLSSIAELIKRGAAPSGPDRSPASSGRGQNGQAAPGAGTPGSAAAAPAEINSETHVKQALSGIVEQARKSSSYLNSRDPADPMGYRLNRLALWLTVEELPPATDGRTLLSAPERRLSDRLVGLSSARDWPALLTSAEEAAFQFIFWLDLQRFSVQALQNMGEKFIRAADAIGRETASFVDRLPGIESLSFSDGAPFAGPETQAWLREIHGAGEPPASSFPSVIASPVDDRIRKDMEDVKQLLRGRKFADAAARFQARLRASLSAREKFLCRLEFAGLLAKTPTSAGEAWIVPQLEQIIEDIETYRLDEFDPALALRGMTLAMKAYRGLPDAASKKKADEVLHRVARIDMTEFVKQTG